jgi:hypothetical protein
MRKPGKRPLKVQKAEDLSILASRASRRAERNEDGAGVCHEITIEG